MSHLVSRFNGKGLVRSRSLTGRLIAAAVATLFMVALVGGTIANASTTGTGTIQSDLADYKPGQQVTLTGAGWAANEPVHIVVNDTIGQTWQHVADVTASGTGDFTDVFNLPNVFVSDYDVTATGPTSGTATTTFTDAAAGALSQCGNGTFASP
ncbi:MAG TPA: hypothetical protein VNN79_23660, partial [Actinomycetota bacterium]|nr:hypothetical protein [Actinomycetota bacterium]